MKSASASDVGSMFIQSRGLKHPGMIRFNYLYSSVRGVYENFIIAYSTDNRSITNDPTPGVPLVKGASCGPLNTVAMGASGSVASLADV